MTDRAGVGADEELESEPRVAVEPVGAPSADLVEAAAYDAHGTFDAVPAAPLVVVSAGAVAWVAAVAAFLLLRLPVIWQAPVGGAEWVHLSGAWQASIGTGGERFAGTLFQAITALLLNIWSSETAPRILAYLATATVPLALYRLRPRIGDAGALLALSLLAIDGPGILLGTTATAMAFDIAVCVWIYYALTRDWIADWAWVAVGLAVALSGPLVLPLASAFAIYTLLTRDREYGRGGLFALAGVLLGVAIASSGYGTGNAGLNIPPFTLFADSFSQQWSSIGLFDLTAIYGVALVLGGIVAAMWALREMVLERDYDSETSLLLAWAGVALLWFLSSLGENTMAPLVALTVPLAMLTGPALARAIPAMIDADWMYARALLPFSLVMFGIAGAYLIKWAMVLHAGDASSKGVVIGVTISGLAAIALVAANQRSLPTVLSIALIAGAFPTLSGAFGIGLSSSQEPLPSPVSPSQARELRDIALDNIATNGGSVVVHPRFEELVTWPFRESGDFVIASIPPPEAQVLIWPAEAPKPEGFVPVDGNWTLERVIPSPAQSFLRYVRWFADRNSLVINTEGVAVYTRATP
ncbi:hypothetical protein AYO38_06545 [bacterium SCGC AG-212-C10]|nr:hypothetical protein AYO38_06545 [bacterium SCGC AG-212-C10]